MAQIEVTIPPELAGYRLDKALARLQPQYPRSNWRTALANGQVTREGRSEYRAHYRVQPGETYLADVTGITTRTHLPATDLGLQLLYNHQGLVAVNKPVGISVHPTRKHQQDTLLNGLYHLLKQDIGEYGVNLLHRLDRDTSGVLLCAITPDAGSLYARQFAQHQVNKIYDLLVVGDWSTQFGEKYIAQDMLNYDHVHKRQQVSPRKGVLAETEFHISTYSGSSNITYLTASPRTGRTHQLRVQTSARGFPIVGDRKYGGIKADRLYLHARQVTVSDHQGDQIKIEAPLPPQFLDYVNAN